MQWPTFKIDRKLIYLLGAGMYLGRKESVLMCDIVNIQTGKASYKVCQNGY